MAIVSTISTVSHRYYVKRSKDEIIRRIEDMRSQLGLLKYTDEFRHHLRAQTNSELANLALEHHAMFPE